MSKIQFWKQFTTWTYQTHNQKHCIRYVKDTILKAIYNLRLRLLPLHLTVFDMSKIQFWKQFTTSNTWRSKGWKLYSICQRYNFESNLQLKYLSPKRLQHCIRYVKDTILKAIYNGLGIKVSAMTTVFDMSKIQFWKQIHNVCACMCVYNYRESFQKKFVNERDCNLIIDLQSLLCTPAGNRTRI